MLSIVWKSAKDRDHYEPIIKAISTGLIEVERSSIEQVLGRRRAYQFLKLEDVINLNVSSLYFALPMEQSTLGIRTLISRNRDYTYTSIGDGTDFGYPRCCIDHFEKNWGPGKTDPSRFMDTSKGVNPYANIYYRWLGVRPVFHLPCSTTCEATVELGKQIVPLYGDLKDELLHILSLPVKYSNVNGIVEVSNPLFKFYTDDTDIVENVIFDSSNVQYYDHIKAEDTWTANGFSSREAMNKAHDFVIKNLKKFEFGSILDLGCGNGLLLDKIRNSKRTNGSIYDIQVKGVDLESKLIVQLDSFEQNNINDIKPYKNVDVVMISVERFYESKASDILFNNLINMTKKYLVVTSYNGKVPNFSPHCTILLQQREGENTITVYKRYDYENQ